MPLTKAFTGDLDLPVLTHRFRTVGFTLVDVGGRRSAVRELRLLAPFAHYVTCEPDADEAQRLAAAPGNWQRFTVVPAALASVVGETVLHVTHKPGMSSLLEPDPVIIGRFARGRRYEVVRQARVPTLTLAAAAATYDFGEPSFLKLDTQGTELDILRSGASLMPSVLGVAVESSFYPFYRNQSLFSEVHAFLQAHGFELYLLQRTNLRHAPVRSDVISSRVTTWVHSLYFREAATLDAANRTRLLGLLLAYGYFDDAFALTDADAVPEVESIARAATDEVRAQASDIEPMLNSAFRDR